MDVQGFAAAGFEPVWERFAEIVGRQAGTSTVGGYTVGFLTGTAGGTVEALENTLRGCLGVPPLPVTGAE